MTERLTLATSAGLPFALLAFHVAMGVVGLAAGIVAITARKGGKWHKTAGLVFVVSMIANGLTASGISVYEGKDFLGGLFTVYLVLTSFTAVRQMNQPGRAGAVGLMLFAFGFASLSYFGAYTAWGMPRHVLNGVPAGMLTFLATIALLAAIGDFRMLQAGGIKGTRRLARHLWRMCFGLFIASGSFSAQLVKMTFMPPQFRSMGMILLLGGGPLVVLLYWMWRVRLRQNLRGLLTAKPIDVPTVRVKQVLRFAQDDKLSRV